MNTEKASTKKAWNLDPASWLASSRFAQWLLVVLGALGLIALIPLALRGPGAGEAAQRYASNSLPFLALYLLLAGSLLACMVRRFKGTLRRVGVEPRPRLAAGKETVIAATAFDTEKAASVLKRAGYHWVQAKDGWAWGVKHRWSPLGTLLLHSAVLLGIAASALALLPGRDSTTHVNAVPGVMVVQPSVPTMTVTSLDYAPGELGTTRRLSVRAVTQDGRSVRVGPDLPVLINATTAVTVEDYDIGPTFSVIPTNTMTPIYRRMATLKLRRPGARDQMIVDAGALGTYRFIVRLDKKDPTSVFVRTERLGKRRMWRLIDRGRVFKRGSTVRLGKMRLRFEGLRPYAVMRVHRSPSSPIITLALLAAVLGASIRLILPRAEATIAASGESSAVTVMVDAYRGSRSASAALALALLEVQ